MDIRKIKKLIELIEETGISEIEVKEGEESLRLSRHYPTEMPPMVRYVSPAPSAHAPQIQSPQAPMAPTPNAAELKSATNATGHKVRAPMVGTLYIASSPEAPPFVTLGQSVQIGDTLCVIEAMKMFNEIEADRAGVVKEILIKNGDPVEYDQPLFIIED
jgi:acetyl-CoA carboxylase biotin carboxyl carrier protein